MTATPHTAPLNTSQLLLASSPHVRHTWTKDCTTIHVHGRLSVLKGTEDGLNISKKLVADLYTRAKHQNDKKAAEELVDAIFSTPAGESLVSKVLEVGAHPIIVLPHPSFDDDDCVDSEAGNRGDIVNALPFEIGARIATLTGGMMDGEIVQKARVGRTKLKRFQRFLWQPSFTGDVSTERPYIIVDDTVTLGGTIAGLNGHIREHGGTVIGVSALAHSSGKNVPLALTQQTAKHLAEAYGPNFNTKWKEMIGHVSDCLTELEGRFLVQWAKDEHSDKRSGTERLHALRDRLDQARTTGE